MAQRLVEVILPADQADDVRELLEDIQIRGPWHERLEDGQVLCRLLLEAEQTGSVVDQIEKRFGKESGFQLIIVPVHASLPRPEEPEEAVEPETPSEEPPRASSSALSREELYANVVDMTKLSRVFVIMVILSATVAAVGVVRDNVAVIIGAMVIAPLLGPNVGLALAATLGDTGLLRKALTTNVVGVLIAMAFAVTLGIVLHVDPQIDEIRSRTTVHLSDVVLALAAGSAGTLALTSGVSSALVGVMVAVALLPPVIVVGLMIGVNEWRLAGGAVLLLLTNVICVNLAGVLTFLLQGVRPLTWWEADKARRFRGRALAIWVILLVLLTVLIVLSQRR